MMNLKEMATKAAMNNRDSQNNLFMELMGKLTSESYNESLQDWIYNAVKKTFQKSFRLWSSGDVLQYSEYETQKGDVNLKLTYEEYEDCMYGIVTIPERPQKGDISCKLAERLRMKRASFLKDWKENARKVMEAYFEEHKEEFLKHPVVYMDRGFITKSFIIWSSIGSNENVEMREKLGILTNQVDEVLNRKSFFPCFWETEDSLTADVRVGGYILHISRVETPDKSFLHDWPNVTVNFELVSSEKLDWSNGLEVIRLHREIKKRNEYKTFKDDLYNRAEWQFRTINGKREVFAYIPVIYDQYTEYICKEAQKEFRGEIRVVGTCQRNVPRYNNDEMTCIEVVVIE